MSLIIQYAFDYKFYFKGNRIYNYETVKKKKSISSELCLILSDEFF